MFDSQKLLNFKLFSYNILKYHRSNVYLFLEHENDIATIHGIRYEMRTHENARDQPISIWSSRKLGYPNVLIFNYLVDMIQFKPIAVDEPTDAMKLTFLGYYDTNVIPLTATTARTVLLSSISVHDSLYVTNLAHKASPTYFADQFVTLLWIAFITTFALFGLIVWLGNACLKKYNVMNLDNFTWYSIITNQGDSETNNSRFLYRKILLTALSMLVIIFHGAFAAFLSSSLAVRIPDLPFTDLNGLLHSTDYTICIMSNTAAHYYIGLYKDGNGRKLKNYNSAACPNFTKNFHRLQLENMKIDELKCPSGKFAYMGLGPFWNSKLSENCNLKPLDGEYFKEYITINTSPGFRYRKQFNVGIVKLRTAGLLHYMVNKNNELGYFKTGLKRGWYKNIDKDENVVYSIEFQQVFIVVMIPFAGITCAIVILWTELRTRTND